MQKERDRERERKCVCECTDSPFPPAYILQLFHWIKPKWHSILHPNICSWGNRWHQGSGTSSLTDGDSGGPVTWGKDVLSEWTQTGMGSLQDPHSCFQEAQVPQDLSFPAWNGADVGAFPQRAQTFIKGQEWVVASIGGHACLGTHFSPTRPASCPLYLCPFSACHWSSLHHPGGQPLVTGMTPKGVVRGWE